MAYLENFSSSESLASPELVTFTDISTGTDGTIVTRRIFIQLANGNWLTSAGESDTETYTTWDYADASITINLLTKSTVGNCTVVWYNSIGTPLYTKTILMEWNLFDYLFLFGLLSAQTSYPAVNSNTGYWPNSFQMITNLFQAEQAVEKMDDLYSAQGALDRNQFFISNQSKYF